ncbi:peptidoglycan-binding protein LysM [Henriciella sp. AS95]|uniref:peptidoglycan-binding protein LysM n=1 Tax=Henriciella sp. AS95 TaxID=3135782 RepID=UPI0031758D7F
MNALKFALEKGKELLDQKSDPAVAIKKEVKDLGLGDDVDIKVNGEKVTITGTAPSQEVKEKIILASGNVVGVSEVEEDIDVASTVFYEVQSGDTLSKIAKAHYGNANRYQEIFEANKPMLKDPDLIYPGQMLRIPGSSAKA